MSFQILPLGVGDAFSALHYSFCLLLSFTDDAGHTTRLLVDCPHPVRKMLREASLRAGEALDLDGVDAVILTHLHGDHASGLESYGYFQRFALWREPTLITHPDVAERLWEGHLAAGMEQLMTVDDEGRRCFQALSLHDHFALTHLDEAAPLRFGPFTIACRKTIHHIPTTALIVSAGGASVGISADTAFDPTLIDWLSGCDVIIHETNFGPAHTDFDELARLPAALRQRMHLIHYPDGFETPGFARCEQGVVIPVSGS